MQKSKISSETSSSPTVFYCMDSEGDFCFSERLKIHFISLSPGCMKKGATKRPTEVLDPSVKLLFASGYEVVTIDAYRGRRKFSFPGRGAWESGKLPKISTDSCCFHVVSIFTRNSFSATFADSVALWVMLWRSDGLWNFAPLSLEQR